MLGVSLKEQRCLTPMSLPYYCVKEAVLPFRKFSTSTPLLSPEMKGTGEVMGIGLTPHEAYLKAQIAAGNHCGEQDSKVVLTSGLATNDQLLVTLAKAGFTLINELKSDKNPDLILVVDAHLDYLSFALQHNIPYASTYEAAAMMVQSLCHHHIEEPFVKPLQELYQQTTHPSKTRHVLTGMELNSQDILSILALAKFVKEKPNNYCDALMHKNLAMIFEKPSFRTRLSFSLAMQSLGGTAVESVSTTRKSEEPRDLVRVLNGYCDFIMVRTHDDQGLDEMATYANVPIINGLSALYHPCQILADLLTLQEYFGTLTGLTLAYIGDGNNILHSLLLMAPQLGIKINYCCPAENQPNAALLAKGLQATPEMIHCHSTPEAAVHDAHAVYTDVWTSMGFEQETDETSFADFQVNEKLMAHAKPEAIFMHCMPMVRGKEVSVTLPDEPAAALFTQSENRLHVQKALLLFYTLIRISLYSIEL
ncbi:ornithine carbamoyltransferase [Legionella tunisiensis]|uniref:ornithine carbamoyltransferase n=1 Tax=Legionella tunisiensis TaxID=1034944 RepID=UPI0002E5B450|nr:ornithine carbamoyltransferase [Legionella tunisiensis]